MRAEPECPRANCDRLLWVSGEWGREREEMWARINRLNAALQLAYDWMGRAPADAWDKAHLDVALKQVEEALRDG